MLVTVLNSLTGKGTDIEVNQPVTYGCLFQEVGELEIQILNNHSLSCYRAIMNAKISSVWTLVESTLQSGVFMVY